MISAHLSRPSAAKVQIFARWAVLCLVVTHLGCASEKASVAEDFGEIPYEKLSHYNLFKGQLSNLEPAAGSVEYQVAAPLWSDAALKQQLVVLPGGTTVGFEEQEDWSFPKSTIVVKSFSFPLDKRDPTGPRLIVETRLLTLQDDGWTGYTYVWNEEQTEAIREKAGVRVDVRQLDEAGKSAVQEYLVPNDNQCKDCHERDEEQRTLGLFTHQMNRPIEVAGETVNQLEHLAGLGLLPSTLPSAADLPGFPDLFGAAPLSDRVGAY